MAPRRRKRTRSRERRETKKRKKQQKPRAREQKRRPVRKPEPPPKRRQQKKKPPPPRKKPAKRKPKPKPKPKKKPRFYVSPAARAMAERARVLAAPPPAPLPEPKRKRRPTRLEKLRELRPVERERVPRPPRVREVPVEVVDRGMVIHEHAFGSSNLSISAPGKLRDTFLTVAQHYADKGALDLGDVTFHSTSIGFRVVGRLEGSSALAEILEYLRTSSRGVDVTVVRESAGAQQLLITMRQSGSVERQASFAHGVLQRAATYAWEVLEAYYDDVSWWVEWESDEDLY
jgi:hypothetical protein